MPFTIGGDWIPSGEDEERKKPKRPVKVRKEKRGNAMVTVILNLPFEKDKLKELAKKLKRKCGCGGTAKEGIIEIQGDKVTEICRELKALGIKSQ